MQPESVGHNSRRDIRFVVVTTPQQWLHASAIRSICFLEEHNMPADWLFDGNDYMATHIVVYDGEEPVGTARIRWFKDFAKIERTSFRKAYRGIAVLKMFAAFGFEHIARKGYTRVITHAGEKYARLWKMVLGFESASKEPAYFEGHEPYYEIWKDIAPVANAISLETSAAVLFRTEGIGTMPLTANDRLTLVELSRPPDADACREVMTIHKATFLKLVQNQHEPDRLADFFQDIASTYTRIAVQLRREGGA